MKEHALPQDVTGYRFHIIGNMTLKQFAEVAGGCVVGFLLYTTNLPDILKWPLIVLSVIIGAMMAFVPFEERPLDQWFVAFFLALYRPTQFYWKRSGKIPEPFLYKPSAELTSLVKDVDLTPARRQRVKEFLRSIDTEDTKDDLDRLGEQKLDEVMKVFESSWTTRTQIPDIVPGVVPDIVPNIVPEPQAVPETEVLSEPEFISEPSEIPEPPAIPESPTIPDTIATSQFSLPETADDVKKNADSLLSDLSQELKKIDTATPSPTTSPSVTATTSPAPFAEEKAPVLTSIPINVSTQQVREIPTNSVLNVNVDDLPPSDVKLSFSSDQAIQDVGAGVLTIENLPTTLSIPQQNAPTTSTGLASRRATRSGPNPNEVSVPELDNIFVEHNHAHMASREEELSSIYSSALTDNAFLDPSFVPQIPILQPVQTVVQNSTLPFPSPPTEPNRVVGMILDKNGDPLPGAIVELLTTEGFPARAIKTNILGQFFITTPLRNGTYTLMVEKEGYQFEPQQIIISGQIIQPIEVRSL